MKIVIVGGGSAGWMTACSLVSQLKDPDITLIESPYVPSIGVGESTLAGLPAWLNAIGVDHEEFMHFTDASYKLSIKFNNFHRIGDGGFHYPFGHPTLENCELPGANDWHVMKHYLPETTTTQSYVDSLFPQSVLLNSRKLKNPKNGELGRFTMDRDFALHFDAIKFAEWLSEHFAKPRGVKHIEANVSQIITNDDGVEKLVLEDGTEIYADLFVDCTGFKSLLLGGAMNEPFYDLKDRLPVNKAWAVQIQYENPNEEIDLYTDCTALGHGWVWNAPLYSRIGTGYVYSDRWTTKEEALVEFKQYLADRIGAHRVPEDSAFREIFFKAGCYERTWVKNVAGIGLSAAFLEPLESNGLFFIHESAMMLSRFLSRGYYNSIDRDFYNGITRKHFESFATFIEYHYTLSSRRDTEFWKYMTTRDVAPKLWESNADSNFYEEMVNKTQNQSYRVAVDSGFHAIAVGHEWYPIFSASIPYWQHLHPTNYEQIAGNFFIKTEKSQKKWNDFIKDAPTHYEYLKKHFHQGDN